MDGAQRYPYLKSSSAIPVSRSWARSYASLTVPQKCLHISLLQAINYFEDKISNTLSKKIQPNATKANPKNATPSFQGYRLGSHTLISVVNPSNSVEIHRQTIKPNA
ncbi:hypothetical protein TUM4630_07700 [Shewanella algidipiscicola]|uniref:Uncharacterized protein n=1 Tax=Shewanella algidipiscicola TaxID=614070 RepID=A0ABQ4P8C4_9GAMM|nr:hypothetical protein TUM4630_07700 [Shewanella algidipiscicola]